MGQVRPFLAARFLAMPELNGLLLCLLPTPFPLVYIYWLGRKAIYQPFTLIRKSQRQ